ncbi:hypothetical protein MKW94_003134 [Papaver nudicaule]|uniref:CRIB domain-containing protein n=1 Tax=Papaver nudicaule TaxID=74823 RepID=A0AA41VNV4_PAPNU|nr:hypothetical protein [Papaver nudicaule]
MKGILKGIRYITQIFENDSYDEEEEEEMQIGNPTDVQHVAHIGVEGPATASPSWMNDKKSESPESGSKTALKKKGEANAKSKTKSPSQDLSQADRTSLQDLPDQVSKPSRNRRHSNSVTLNSSETQELSSEVPKKSSRRGHSLDLTEQKKSSTTKKSKDHSNSSTEVLDTPSIPKSSRKKKLNESPSTVGVASARDRRKGSKDSNSLSTSNIHLPGPASEANKNNSSDELSRHDLNDLRLEEKGF